MPALLRKLLPALTLAAMLTACESVDDDRIPYAEVHLTFHTVGDWNIYGVQGRRSLIAHLHIQLQGARPSNFPYTTLDRTGYGGLLLVTDVLGDLHAYDLACPFEVRPNVRVSIPEGELFARCPSCGSTFDVFQNRGNPHLRPGTGTGLRPRDATRSSRAERQNIAS